MQIAEAIAELARDPSGRPPAGRPDMQLRSENSDGALPRVLIVEDELFVAQDARDILEAAGYEVVGMARTAEAAIERTAALRPDLVLMDIHLVGRRDGIEAALWIRRELGIRSVFMSAYEDAGTRERAATADPVAFVAKPFSPESLLEALRKPRD
jgi:CheY-like chemotaxis protein